MSSHLSAPQFLTEEAAYAFVEARIWPRGATCPKCGGREHVSKMGGKSTRIGTYKCYQCRKQFTVKIGTIFEASHVPMNVWLPAIYLICGSKKGVSSNQLHRTLGVTLKTAWFMSHRIREAMRSGALAPMGGGGSFVEVDETHIGTDPSGSGTQHRGRKHPHRYMAEFDFRHSNRVALGVHDSERADRALMGIVEKRLTYQTVGC